MSLWQGWQVSVGFHNYVRLFSDPAVSGPFLGAFVWNFAFAFLSVFYTPLWVEGMVAGRGWIALALVVFATWRPVRMATCRGSSSAPLHPRTGRLLSPRPGTSGDCTAVPRR